MALSITRFSLHGQNLGRLSLLAAEHIDALDGTDQLTVSCYDDLAKHDRLVWRDKQGTWHEHIVDEPWRGHDEEGRPVTVATCINSIAETWDDYVLDVRPSGVTQVALDRIMAGTRWTSGVCTQSSSASHTFYHISVREALQELIEVWGGELVTVIGVDSNKVTSRTVKVVSARGNQDSHKRFTWTKDLISIKRKVGSTNPKTRIYAYGKGEETDSGGYGRRIGIESVNNNVPYVEDVAATQIWGRPDGNGGMLPAIGKYTNEQCDDPAQLLAEVTEYLAQAKAPQVTYEANVIDLADYGRAWEEVSVGDRVAIIDKEFSPEGIRLHGRISRIERDLLEGTTKVVFGTLVDAIANPWRTIQSRLASLTNKSANWDLAAAGDGAWLDVLMTQLNAAYNTAGTYHYESFEKGEIWSSVPLDDDGNATVTGGWAMNINGMGFRLASSLNPDGTWNWRTFGNGNGFTADELIAGFISANLIQGGILKLGGANNVNGTLEVYDANGDVVTELDNDGVIFRLSVRYYASGSTNTSTNDIEVENGIAVAAGGDTYADLTGATLSSGVTANLVGLRVENKRAGTTRDHIVIIPSHLNSSSSNSYHSTIAASGNLDVIPYYEGGSAFGSLRLRKNKSRIQFSDSGYSEKSYVECGANGSQVSGQTVYLGSNVGTGNKVQFLAEAAASKLTASTITVSGSLTVSGTKNRAIDTKDYDNRLLYAYETAEPLFGDVGGGTIGEDGIAVVDLDPILAQTITGEYRVTLQKCGPGDLWVAEKKPGWFVVEGTPGLAFDWELKARQRDYGTARLEDVSHRDDAESMGEMDTGVEHEYDGELPDLDDLMDFALDGCMEDAGSLIDSLLEAYEMEAA